jgi:NAD(P)-dependent dehydrogenase (short-subunit alcohol dehydrogenase family)
MLRGIEEKVVLVTGAADGMGAAAARRLYEEGARVALLDLDGAKVEGVAAELGDRALPLRADISSEEDVERAAAAVGEHFGRIDLAFLNAGVTGATGPLAEVQVEDFDRTIAVNLRGCYLTMRASLRSMISRGEGGAIVATASMLALQGGPMIAAYTASKHGIVGLVRATALENGPLGIRINALCPGYVDTPMTRAFEDALDDPRAAREVMQAKNALGRYAEPEEIAAMAVWLLSDEATYCSGACFSVDGGITAGESLSA